MCCRYIASSVKQAVEDVELMAVLEGAMVSSMVEDAFFILKTAFTRSVQTCNEQAACATVRAVVETLDMESAFSTELRGTKHYTKLEKAGAAAAKLRAKAAAAAAKVEAAAAEGAGGGPNNDPNGGGDGEAASAAAERDEMDKQLDALAEALDDAVEEVSGRGEWEV